MPGKVFHISDGVHKLVVKHCQDNNLSTRSWIESTLIQAVKGNNRAEADRQSSIPNKKERIEFFAAPKKKMEVVTMTRKDDDLWSQPPFWAK